MIYVRIGKRFVEEHVKPLWRNWLARSAVNRKVGGSSPPGGVSKVCLPMGDQAIVIVLLAISFK